MKFCKYCGTQLNDEETCSCENAQKEAAIIASEKEEFAKENSFATEETSYSNNQAFNNQQAYESNQTSNEYESVHNNQADHKNSVSKTALSNVIPFIKALFKAPKSAIHTAASNTDLPLAGIFYALYFFSFVIFELVAVDKINKGIKFLSMLSGSHYGFKIKNSWIVTIVLICTLTYFVCTIIATLILAKIAKSRYNAKQLIAGTSSIFVAPTLCYLVASVFMFLDLSKLTLCIIFISFISYIIMSFYTIHTLCNKDSNSSFLWSTIIVVSFMYLALIFASFKLSISYISKSVMNSTKNHYDYLEDYDDYDDYDDLKDLYKFFQ